MKIAPAVIVSLMIAAGTSLADPPDAERPHAAGDKETAAKFSW
jgi:hypothetical protein